MQWGAVSHYHLVRYGDDSLCNVEIVLSMSCVDHSGIRQKTNSSRRTVTYVSKSVAPVLIKERVPRYWSSSKKRRTR